MVALPVTVKNRPSGPIRLVNLRSAAHFKSQPEDKPKSVPTATMVQPVKSVIMKNAATKKAKTTPMTSATKAKGTSRSAT
jgi:hypothetical protein